MSRVHYFAYGSNLDGEQMQRRCPSARGLFPARLRDHRLDFTYLSSRWAGGAADVVPHSGETVWGIVYELDTGDLVRLDRFEGGYDRVHLLVQDEQEQGHPVISYQVQSKGSFRPTPQYREKMLNWAEHWRLPETYLARLRSLEVSADGEPSTTAQLGTRASR